jgi:hypothetical protein
MTATEILFSPHEIGPAAWARATANGETGVEALCKWMELTAEVTERRGAVDQIDATVNEFHYEYGETEPSPKSGAQPNHGHILWQRVISKYGEKLCRLGLTPRQAAAAMEVSVERLYQSMFPSVATADAIDMVDMIAEGAPNLRVCAEFGYGRSVVESMSKRLALRHDKIGLDLYDETPRGMASSRPVDTVDGHDFTMDSPLWAS